MHQSINAAREMPSSSEDGGWCTSWYWYINASTPWPLSSIALKHGLYIDSQTLQQNQSPLPTTWLHNNRPFMSCLLSLSHFPTHFLRFPGIISPVISASAYFSLVSPERRPVLNGLPSRCVFFKPVVRDTLQIYTGDFSVPRYVLSLCTAILKILRGSFPTWCKFLHSCCFILEIS